MAQSVHERWLTDRVLHIPATGYRDIADAELNLYCVKGSRSVAVIDAGIPATTVGVHAALADAGIGVDEIDTLLVTHGHEDHFTGAASWRAAQTKLRLGAPIVDAAWVEDVERTMRNVLNGLPGVYMPGAELEDWVRKSFWGEPARVDFVVRDGDRFDLGDATIAAFHVGGHAPGHLVYLEEESAILFCGDAVQGSGFRSCSGATSYAPFYCDADEYRTGLARIAALDFVVLAPTHTSPMPREAALDWIRESIEFADSVDELIDAMLERKTSLLTSEVAEAIGTQLGAFGGVTMATAWTATAHLRQRARAGQLASAWEIPYRNANEQRRLHGGER